MSLIVSTVYVVDVLFSWPPASSPSFNVPFYYCFRYLAANTVIKAVGGAIGVTEDPSALRRWMVAGPEVSQLVAQYEIASEAKDTVVHTNHHEQTPKVQQVFNERVHKLLQVFTYMGNLFKEESRDLCSLDLNDIAHPSAAELIFTHHDRGRKRFVEFMDGLEFEAKCPHSTNQTRKPELNFSDRNHVVWTLQNKRS